MPNPASPSAVTGSVFYAENQIIFGIVYYCTVYTEQYTYCTGIYVYSTVCRIQVAIENKYCTMYVHVLRGIRTTMYDFTNPLVNLYSVLPFEC